MLTSIYLKLGAALAILIVVGLGYWHYIGIVTELAVTKADLAVSQRDLSAAVGTAKANAAQVERVTAEGKRQVDAVQKDFEAYKTSISDIATSDAAIDAAPQDNGPLAPVLKNWRPQQ